MSATVNTSKYQQWANLAKQNGWSEQELASAFVTQSRQNGQSKQEIIQEYKQVLAEYDNLRNQPANVDSRSMGEKVADTMRQYGGSAAKFGEAIGDSLAANYTTKLQQEAQQQRIGQEQIIYDRIRQARQAGNEQEVQRLLGILNDPQYTDNTDYNAQVRAYRRGIQDAIQGGVGTLAEFASTGIPKAGSLGSAIAQGALSGSIQGAAMSDADLINDGQYDQLAQDTLMGAGVGAASGAVSYGVDKSIQKGKQAVGDWLEQRSAKGSKFSPPNIEEYEMRKNAQVKQDTPQTTAKTKAQQAQSTTSQAAKTTTQPINEEISEVIAEKEVIKPMNFRELDERGRKVAQREIDEFYLRNNISTPRQVGKAYNPRDTFLEVNEQLKDQGLSLSNLTADDIIDMSELITGDQGATTKITREIISDTTKPLSKTVEINGKKVDPVMQAVRDTFKKSSKLRTDKKAQREITDLLQATLDEASHDLNKYDIPKLYDALKEIEGYAAEMEQVANRSIMPNLVDKQTAKVYRAAADELSNLINRASVDQGVFNAGRDRLANYYKEIGMNRLSQQVAQAKNLGQLRTTAKPWVRASLLINDGQASMFSTFNKNTNLMNSALKGISWLPGGKFVQGAFQTADAATGGRLGRQAGYVMEDVVENLR